MTVPAPQSGSSASAQQAGSSSSASAQTPTFAHDTVTQGTSVTGLAGVFAERDAQDVAAKIAEEVGKHLPADIREIRVIGDLSGLGDITSLRILEAQVEQFSEQITAYGNNVSAAPRPTEPPEAKKILPVAAGLSTAVNLFGLVTQLLAGTYTYSGQSLPNASIGGLDILIAEKLKSDARPVHVDRFATMPADSKILQKIQEFVPQAAKDLNSSLIRATEDAAGWAQIVTNDKDRLTELDTEEKAVLDKPPPDPGKVNEDLDNKHKAIWERLPDESGHAATAQSLLTQGQALATAISAFVTTAMSAPASGGLPPVAHAAHGEVLSKDGTALLYAQVIAAGDDQILRQDLIHNTWTNLTGLTAEYALIMPGQGNEATAFGMKTAYAVRHGSIRKGLNNVQRTKPTRME